MGVLYKLGNSNALFQASSYALTYGRMTQVLHGWMWRTLICCTLDKLLKDKEMSFLISSSAQNSFQWSYTMGIILTLLRSVAELSRSSMEPGFQSMYFNRFVADVCCLTVNPTHAHFTTFLHLCIFCSPVSLTNVNCCPKTNKAQHHAVSQIIFKC